MAVPKKIRSVNKRQQQRGLAFLKKNNEIKKILIFKYRNKLFANSIAPEDLLDDMCEVIMKK